MFKQRITPSEPQKQEIRNIILDNNIASVHNSTLRPFKPLNAPKSNYDDFPPELDIPEPDPPRSLKYSILTPGDSFNRDNFFPEEKKPEITIRQLLSDNRPIARKVHDVIDLEKSYPHFEQKNWQSYEYKPPKREYVPPVLKQDLITRLYTKPKDTDERSPTRPSTAASSYQSSIDKGKIWEQPNPLVEKYKKETPKESVKERPKPAKDRDYNTDPKRAVKEAISKPAPVPQKTKEELEKELAKKRAEELAAIEEAARKKEEERRKAIVYPMSCIYL